MWVIERLLLLSATCTGLWVPLLLRRWKFLLASPAQGSSAPGLQAPPRPHMLRVQLPCEVRTGHPAGKLRKTVLTTVA